MRKQWITCLLIMAFLTVFNMTNAHAVIVSLNVLDNHIEVGEHFGVEVWVDNEGLSEELLAFGFDVDTSGNHISYLGYAIGSGFDDFSNPSNFNNVSGDAFPGIADNDVLLATLSFSADSVGVDSLALDGLYDGLFYGLFYEVSGFDLSASTNISVLQRSVPAPGTMLLTGFACLVLCALGRGRTKALP